MTHWQGLALKAWLHQSPSQAEAPLDFTMPWLGSGIEYELNTRYSLYAELYEEYMVE